MNFYIALFSGEEGFPDTPVNEIPGLGRKPVALDDNGLNDAEVKFEVPEGVAGTCAFAALMTAPAGGGTAKNFAGLPLYGPMAPSIQVKEKSIITIATGCLLAMTGGVNMHLSRLCAHNVNAFRVAVSRDDGQAEHADHRIVNHAGRMAGLTMQSGTEGSAVNVL
ncbi:MAG: hypothetical protein GY862_19860, partial [Gammaproteobacteria bacterium]|nr:hypothetical protein [Gammaproteobacteria bacterium]